MLVSANDIYICEFIVKSFNVSLMMACSRNALEENNFNVNILVLPRNWLFILFDGEQRAFYWKYRWFHSTCICNMVFKKINHFVRLNNSYLI